MVVIEQTLQQTYFRRSARCVQSFDDSLDFAIRMTYRISLRSSSLWEPRHPLLKVFFRFLDWKQQRSSENDMSRLVGELFPSRVFVSLGNPARGRANGSEVVVLGNGAPEGTHKLFVRVTRNTRDREDASF